jgi:glutamate formiminotransferase
MPLVTIPNVSEGRDEDIVSQMSDALTSRGSRVLDVHVDARHNRSVLTATGDDRALTDGLVELASRAAASIDLTVHAGAHPRVGALDVCPIVPHREPMERAIAVARAVGHAIGHDAALPVYFYDGASDAGRSLPEIRAGGLKALIARAARGCLPDAGPATIDARRGVVCVGARDVLIAFNVWLRCDVDVARSIARSVRARDGGLPGVRALGVALGEGLSQVSMNLVQPDRTGIDDAFAAVAATASKSGAEIVATELVGLVPERFLPAPDAPAARLLREPGRSLESVLKA